MEEYVDDMILKTTQGHSHEVYLKDFLQSGRRYIMCLNPTKCSFGVEARKFLGFMWTKIGIEANSYKCQVSYLENENMT